ncbi:MAG: ABC transporter substrate-binding protein [Gemmatimonadetes bacterium]|nr:ABC transporter substrate-binding protein [Gemmatimonadota bacterium]
MQLRDLRGAFTSALLIFLAAGSAPGVTLKIATLAPPGTTWMKVMEAMNEEVGSATGGAVKLKFYPGGVAGDEHDVLRKMRVGQLHGGGFTGVGLGEILPKIRALEVPFLYRTYDEVDHVRASLESRFLDSLEEEGYVLLGWAEVGFVHIFANTPIRDVDDLRKVRMWMWEGDPLAEAFFDAFEINPTPLQITDVLTSLQTGLIDAIYTSPYAAVGLQWFTRVKYMMDLPFTDALGAVIVTKKQFDKIPMEYRAKVLEICRRHSATLNDLTRQDQKTAISRMRKEGIKVIPVDKSMVESWETIGAKAREGLVGKLYDRETLGLVLGALEEYRASRENPSSR